MAQQRSNSRGKRGFMKGRKVGKRAKKEGVTKKTRLRRPFIRSLFYEDVRDGRLARLSSSYRRHGIVQEKGVRDGEEGAGRARKGIKKKKEEQGSAAERRVTNRGRTEGKKKNAHLPTLHRPPSPSISPLLPHFRFLTSI